MGSDSSADFSMTATTNNTNTGSTLSLAMTNVLRGGEDNNTTNNIKIDQNSPSLEAFGVSNLSYLDGNSDVGNTNTAIYYDGNVGAAGSNKVTVTISGLTDLEGDEVSPSTGPTHGSVMYVTGEDFQVGNYGLEQNYISVQGGHQEINVGSNNSSTKDFFMGSDTSLVHNLSSNDQVNMALVAHKRTNGTTSYEGYYIKVDNTEPTYKMYLENNESGAFLTSDTQELLPGSHAFRIDYTTTSGRSLLAGATDLEITSNHASHTISGMSYSSHQWTGFLNLPFGTTSSTSMTTQTLGVVEGNTTIRNSAGKQFTAGTVHLGSGVNAYE